MTPPNRDSPNTCCGGGSGGDGCDSGNPWPLHQIRHRSAFLRLCTSCVLRYHPGSFCTACFDVLDPPPDRPLVYCASCPAVAHVACLPAAADASANYLCPLCSSPHGFSYFHPDRLGHDEDTPGLEIHHRTIDLSTSKVLLTAAKISAASMNRAVAAARVEAERKAKEAAVASKQARGLLDRMPQVSRKEMGMVEESVKRVAAAASVATKSVREEEPKRKIPRTGGSVASDVSAHKKFQDRQREKFMRYLEPTQIVRRHLGEGVPAVNSVHNGVSTDLKGRVASMAPTSNHVKQEEREKETIMLSPSFQDASIVKEERKKPAIEEDNGLRISHSPQELLAS